MGQDPLKDQNARTGTTRRRRAAARNDAPPDREHRAPLSPHTQIENLLLVTLCPEWREKKVTRICSEWQSYRSIRSHICSRYLSVNIPILPFSHSAAAQLAQDPSEEQNARTDPNRRRRDPVPNCVPTDGANSEAMRAATKRGIPLRDTVYPK